MLTVEKLGRHEMLKKKIQEKGKKNRHSTNTYNSFCQNISKVIQKLELTSNKLISKTNI